MPSDPDRLRSITEAGERFRRRFGILAAILVPLGGAVAVAGIPWGDRPGNVGLLVLGPIILAAGVLSFEARQGTVAALRGHRAVGPILLSLDGFAIEGVSSKRLSFHAIFQATIAGDGGAVPVSIELVPESGSRLSDAAVSVLASRPLHIRARIPWPRPDLLLVHGWFFYADMSGLHPLEAHAFRKDVWMSPWEGLYTNWVAKRLELRLLVDPATDAARLRRAFDAFRAAVALADAVGTYGPRYRDEEITISLPLTFGFLRFAYCSHCGHTMDRFRWDVPRCPKCAGPVVKTLARSGLGYENPKRREAELRHFAHERLERTSARL